MIGGRPGGQSGEGRRSVMETAIGIALVVIAALEIFWITRTVTANTPR
jgi:hypothetical protein